jgi:hypothetical protein
MGQEMNIIPEHNQNKNLSSRTKLEQMKYCSHSIIKKKKTLWMDLLHLYCRNRKNTAEIKAGMGADIPFHLLITAGPSPLSMDSSHPSRSPPLSIDSK